MKQTLQWKYNFDVLSKQVHWLQKYINNKNKQKTEHHKFLSAPITSGKKTAANGIRTYEAYSGSSSPLLRCAYALMLACRVIL